MLSMPLENLDDLEAEWAIFMEDREGPRGKWTQDQRWRADNPGALTQLLAYRNGTGPRPDFSEEQATGRRMVEHLDAWWDAKGPPDPPPPPPVKKLTQTIQNGETLSGQVGWFAAYDGDADDVPDDPGSIQFFVDGTLVLTENLPPFGNPAGFWDSTTVEDGEHTFQVKAFDEGGAFIIESELATAAVDNDTEPPPPPPTARLVAQALYEGYADVDNVPLWQHHVQAAADSRMEIVDDPLGQRGKVMRVQVLPGDNQIANSGTGERADVYASRASAPDGEGAIVAVRLPVMLPDGFASSGSGWNVPMGWHATDTGNGQPFLGAQSPVQVWIQNGHEMWIRMWGGEIVAPNTNGNWRQDFRIGSLARNRWYDIVFGEKISVDPNKGRLVVMVNGAEVIDAPVANLLKKGSIVGGRYLKQGWYRAATSYPTTLFFDSTKIWTADTLEDAVAAAIADPVGTFRAC